MSRELTDEEASVASEMTLLRQLIAECPTENCIERLSLLGRYDKVSREYWRLFMNDIKWVNP